MANTPFIDDEAGLCIDRCWTNLTRADGTPHPSAGKYRVYYWAKRPDAELHGGDDQYHWHPDSEHDTREQAEARLDALKKGAAPQSILIHGTKH